NYLGRLSGPLLDRLDIQVEVPTLKYQELSDEQEKSESSREIRRRVNNARAIQQKRFSGKGIYCNAQMSHAMIKKYCHLGDEETALLSDAYLKLNLTVRAHNRILKVARTIADLESAKNINTIHIAEAIQYRAFDRSLFR
ncbi:MAG: ATP-binding protein, partial [Clostridiaceae bacterium]|nr:ATP-binding protein [Clostridiaceae bacterium]